MDPVQEFLSHHGVKGMKWGVRQDKGHEGETAKTKKIARLDKKFERNSQTLNTTIKLHNRAAELTNKNDVERINNKPEYKNANFLRDSPLRQKYYREHEKAFLDNLEKAASEFGTNASGTKKYSILEKPDGSWDVNVYDVKHAGETSLPSVKVHYDSKGFITSLEIVDNTVQHAEEVVTEVLSHHGIKGMKWGVRRSNPSGPVDVSVVAPAGKRVKTSGGQGQPAHEDAKAVAVSRQKAKASTTDSLSTKELQNLVKRMQLEQQLSQLNAGRQSAGKKFVGKLLGSTAQQQAQRVAQNHATRLVDEAMKKNAK